MATKTQLSYKEQITRLFRQAAKRRDEAAMQYYGEAFSGVACVSFERFKGSWAGENWLKQRGFKIVH